jgi:hypothetical protein
MKKVCLLSAMIILSAITSLHAMETSRRPEIYTMIDQQITDWRHVNWPAVFAVLNSMQGVIGVNEYRSPQDDTLLYLAAVGTGSYVAAKTLLEKYGANPNLNNNPLFKGVTPLRQLINQLTVRGVNVRTDLPMIQLLLAYGANPNIKDSSGDDCFFEVEKMMHYKHPLASDLAKILEPYRK